MGASLNGFLPSSAPAVLFCATSSSHQIDDLRRKPIRNREQSISARSVDNETLYLLLINGESQENVSSFTAVDPLSLSTVIDFHHVVDWSNMDLVEGSCLVKLAMHIQKKKKRFNLVLHFFA